MYSTNWCADCARARQYFDVNGISYEEIDIESNDHAAKLVEKLNNGNKSVPTILISNNESKTEIKLVEPSWEELDEIFGPPSTE